MEVKFTDDTAVNLVMKNTLVLFGFSRSRHAALIEKLRHSGYRIIATANISKFHKRLTGAKNPLVLIPESVVQRYNMPPTAHLIENHATFTVLVIATGASGENRVTVHRNPFMVTPCAAGESPGADRPDGVKEIIELIEKGSREETCAESTPLYGAPDTLLPPESDGGRLPEGVEEGMFHRKMRHALGLITGAGKEGIDCFAIAVRLWPKSTRNRCKDIQIYISKIRKRLDSIEPNRFLIHFEKGRYRFTDTRQS